MRVSLLTDIHLMGLHQQMQSISASLALFTESRAQVTSSTHVKTHKLYQVCKQVVTSLFTSCQQVVFALLAPSLL